MIARKSSATRARHTSGAMKRPTHIDPLEETMENPDLPPLPLPRGAGTAAVPRPTRRSFRRTFVLGVLLLAGVFVALRLIAT